MANSSPDEVMVSLMKLIIGFSPDFLNLERRDLVESIQIRYMHMLHRYLKYKFGEGANKRLNRALEIATMAREAYEIDSRKQPCLQFY